MAKKLTVLLSGGGAPGTAGSIHCLKHNDSDHDVRVVAVDARGDVEGRYLADAFHTVPSAHQPGYLLAMRRIARQEGVDVILPQTTAETVVLSQNKEYFEEIGVKVAVSDAEAVRVANDKVLVMEVAKELDVPVPEFYRPKSWMELEADAARLGYPRNKVVVKPCVSNGMRGLRIITDEKWGVARFLSEKPSGTEMSLNQLGAILCRGKWPDILVSEFLPGMEFSVDCFSDGVCSVAIPRRRVKIRDGITTRAQVELSEDFHGDKMAEWSKRLGKELGLQYCYGFQFKQSVHGVLCLLEANPRCQGGMWTASVAGFNVIWAAVQHALGKSVDLANVALREVTMQRYWGLLGIDSGRVISTTWGGG